MLTDMELRTLIHTKINFNEAEVFLSVDGTLAAYLIIDKKDDQAHDERRYQYLPINYQLNFTIASCISHNLA